MTSPEKPKSVPEIKAEAVPPADEKGVLLTAIGDLVPGRLVSGSAAEIAALVTARKARRATPADIGIAGGRVARLPRV